MAKIDFHTAAQLNAKIESRIPKLEDYRQDSEFQKSKQLTLLINQFYNNHAYSIKHQTIYRSWIRQLREARRNKKDLSVSTAILNCLTGFSEQDSGIIFIDKYKVKGKQQPVNNIEKYYKEPEFIEFPLPHPSFPATPTFPFAFEQYKYLYIKDESKNRLGTHKNRMAWEIYLEIRKLRIADLQRNISKTYQLSIISTGSAALSIFYLLNHYQIPFVIKVLTDPKIVTTETYKIFQQLNVHKSFELYETDLENEEFNSQKLLKITNNEQGIDLTFGNTIEHIKLRYYDWLVFEIINQNPNHIFVPFGSGDLYSSILETITHEIQQTRKSKRYFGIDSILKETNVFGATTDNHHSVCEKLYTPKPFHPRKNLEPLITRQIENGWIGTNSSIINIEEEYIQQAEQILQSSYLNNVIQFEPSGISGLALFLQLKDEFSIPAEDKILIINTGRMNLELF